MSDKILKQARLEIAKFNSQGGFSVDIVLKGKDGLLNCELKGISTNHFLSFDTSGNQINSRNAHVLISEKDLISNEYSYKNSKTNEISLFKHKISVMNQNNEMKNFVVSETYPSETFGMIVLMLSNHE